VTPFETAALLVSLAAGFSYLNHRVVRLPTTIGLMAIALSMSLGLIAFGKLGAQFPRDLASVIASVDFDQTLMHGMLSFLLFAGSLHLDLGDLRQQGLAIAFFATLGVALSTVLVGLASFWLFPALGHPMPLLHCLLFGALISPTDPVAVLGMLKSAGAPRALAAKLAGESLFNDGVAVVVFTVLLDLTTGAHPTTFGETTALLLQEALGGALFGLAVGYVAYLMLRSLDVYQVEVLITLALVMGGYALASALHLSGPIAIVVAGLLIGNPGRAHAMSDTTREHLDSFWELIDESLNAVLFVLIGLEVLALSFDTGYMWSAVLSIGVVLAARATVVSLPRLIPRLRRLFAPLPVAVLTWAGLRGGISVAMALSLPIDRYRAPLVTVTYVVVVFSVLVQGLTLPRLLRHRVSPAEARP
jgi:CPA1 family monovalent cation:H+ antiporter